MKKILTAVFASAFALVLAAPVASACPGKEGKVAKEKKEEQKGEVAKKKSDTQPDSKENQEAKPAEKKPVKVSSN